MSDPQSTGPRGEPASNGAGRSRFPGFGRDIPPTAGRPPQIRFGYVPLGVVFVAFVVMVALVPSKTSGSSTPAPLPYNTDSGSAGPGGQVAARTVTGDVPVCTDRKDQVANDPYSPPCFTYTGTDNGGETTRGITPTTIRVAYRVTPDTDYASVVQQMAASDIPPDSPEAIQRTMHGLVEYFNKNFQFYGRKIELVPYDAKGTVIGEIFGGGQDTATADAVKVDTELNVFADVSAITEPYANALTKRKIVALSPPYVSDQWFQERRPYGWSLAPSCSLVSRAATEYANNKLFGRPAKWAGGDLKDKTRTIAVITPDNPEYQRCADDGMKVIEGAGNHALRLTYTLDLSNLSNQAASLIARLKSEGITSVGCACDPLLPIFLTNKAEEQGYQPEWLVMGTALTDSDFAGQLYNKNQWKRAFGASALGDQLPVINNEAYRAYKTIASDEPSHSAELLYYQLYMLAIGFQMAGPNLTPQTFEAGMLAYPERTGEAGTWKFLPGKYTPQIDAREIYWDNDKISPFDFRKGAYAAVGPRIRLGGVSKDEPQVFENAPTTTAPPLPAAPGAPPAPDPAAPPPTGPAETTTTTTKKADGS